jgi:hypothetical protein
MEDATVKAGLLLEAVEAQRALADTALAGLQQHTAGLDGLVRRRSGPRSSRSCAPSRRRAGTPRLAAAPARPRRLRLALRSIGSALLGAALPLGLAACFLPSGADLVRLTAARDALAGEITRLGQAGALAQLRRCGAARRLCVRIDRSAPAYGEHADYLVIQGY